jgi:hypothetical protein
MRILYYMRRAIKLFRFRYLLLGLPRCQNPL